MPDSLKYTNRDASTCRVALRPVGRCKIGVRIAGANCIIIRRAMVSPLLPSTLLPETTQSTCISLGLNRSLANPRK